MNNFIKHDNHKIRMELLDPYFIEGVANVLTLGAQKYSAYNWQNMDEEGVERVKGAMLRHTTALMRGEEFDIETKLHHAYHIACNAMFLAWYDRNRVHNDTISLSD